MDSLYSEAVQITYYMRGGIQLFDALELTKIERDNIKKFIKEHIDNELKKPPTQCY